MISITIRSISYTLLNIMFSYSLKESSGLLQIHNREHPVWLYYRLVWQLHRHQPLGSAERGADGPVRHWGQAPCPPGHLHQAVFEEVPEDHQGLQSPDCSLCYSLARGIGASGLEPAGYETVSTTACD